MPPASGSREEDARLSGARAEFVGSLPRRLDALRGALEVLEQEPGDPERVNGLLRRVHAVGSAARVLGFASVAEALAEAEKSVRKAGVRAEGSSFVEVSRALDLLPSLVLGAPLSTRGPESRERQPSPVAFPLSALVLGSEALAEALSSGAGRAAIEHERTDDPERALELARMLGPDVTVVDGDHEGARQLIERLLADDLVEPMPIVVVGSFENPENTRSFVELGADRVLPKPCSPDTLRRTVEELRERRRPRTGREPLGDVSVEGLAERIAAEFRRGLVEALDVGSPNARVSLGEGHDVLGAVWGAVARVRELVTLRSSGELRFQSTGPEGAVPIVPWGATERRAGERGPRAREAVGVPLEGRRVVVADDDPAVVWFMAGLLKAVGVEVLEAHDGKRALGLTLDAWPDVVVSDVMMPKLDGFSLCHEIKRDVVVRDTPVILLSWKEDLLQRVRELGAGADGYLRKEAAASAVVERIREVLRARARVEERIRAGGEVRGRLDGLTTRLVLELSCREGRDVRVSVRDAAFLFEAQVRRGRLVSLSRSSQDGSFERGASVLPSLLGATAGRFVVEPDSSHVRTELSGPLSDLVRVPVGKVRSALAAVGSNAIARLRKLELDRPLVEAYLASTPEPAAGIMRRLLAGDEARSLLLEGGVAARLLEAVLSDIARRGGVLSAELDPPSVPAPLSEPPPEPVPFIPGAFVPGGLVTSGGLAPDAGPPAATLIRSSAESSTTVAAPAVNLLAPSVLTSSKAEDDDDAGWFSDAPVAPPAPPAAPAAAAAGGLRVAGLAATMPLSDSVTPAIEASGPLAAPEPRTLEGLGSTVLVAPKAVAEPVAALAPATPPPARAPESSSPELVAEETTEDLLGLLGDGDVASAKAPAGGERESRPSSPALDAPVEDARRLPTKPPTARATRAQAAEAKKQPQPVGSESTGWGVLLLKGGLAFALAFAITSWVLPILSPPPVRDAGPEPAAPGVEPAAR